MNRTFDIRESAPRLGDGAPQVSAAPRSVPSEQPIFRLDLVRSLRMHRRLALGFVIAGVVLAAIYLVTHWSTYEAQSLVYIQPTPPAGLASAAPLYNYDPATYDSNIQQQITSMTRPDVLAGAVKKLDPGVWQQSGESDQSAADRLSGAISVKRVGTSYQVAITAHAKNADTAAAIANAVAQSYIDNTSHEQKAGDADRLAMLKEERDRIKKELDDDRAEQAALNAELGVAAIGPEAPEHYDTDIGAIHEELVKARADHDEAAARLTSMNASNGLSSSALDAEAEQLISTDPGLSSLKQALLARRATLVSQMANLTPAHPQYKQDQEELAKIDASLASATQELRAKAAARIEQQLRTDLDRTAGLEARLNVQLSQLTKAAAGATPKLQRSSDLANDITRLQNRFNTVDEQLQNQTLEDNAPGTAHLAEAATPPAYPSDGGALRIAFLLLFAFIAMGAAAAVAAQKLDPRVYVAADVEQLLGYGPMAQLPNFDEVSDEVAEEHLLRLATGIEFASKEGRLTNCVFTGTGPGVGVTTIVTRVREMLGVLGKEAVLVDAAGPVPQERRPDGPARVGTELQRSVRASALTPHLHEAAESDQEGLMLTDTAPLTVSAEAEYMARRADCTILVIESARTTRAQLRAAAASLQRLNAAAVGFVLNRVSLENADESFRHSVSEVERHLRVQGRTAARTVAQTSRRTPEAEHASPVQPSPRQANLRHASPAREIPVLAETAASAAAMFDPPPPRRTAPAPVEQERVAAPSQPLPQPAPLIVVDKQEPPAAPPAPAALREIDPVSLWSAGPKSQASHKLIVSRRPERAPDAPPAETPSGEIDKREAQATPKHAAPPVPWGMEPVSMPAEKPAAVFTEKPAAAPPEKPAAAFFEKPFAPLAEKPIAAHAEKPIEFPAAKTAVAAVTPPAPKPLRPIEEPKPQQMSWTVTPPAPPLQEEIPWWLTEAPAHTDSGASQSRSTRVGTWHSAVAPAANQPAPAEVREEETAGESPTPLSGLRGVLFSLGIKEFGPKKSSERNGNGYGESHGNGNAAYAEAAPVDPEQTMVLESFPPRTEPAPLPPVAEPTQEEPAAPRGLPRWVTAEPEFLPPPAEEVETAKPSRWNYGNYEGEDIDGVQILPARRGQYKR